MKELQEQQRSQFYRQLIALDMKEKAMRAYVDKMEKQCMDHVDSRVDCWKKGMESWKSSTESKMQEWKILLEKEVKVNAHFRNDLTHWMEEQMLFRDELTHWMEEQVQKSVQTPFMFATNLGEMNEETPLCPDKKNDFVGDADRVKKRPWKPFFRHWDRIMLQDDK